MKLSLDVGPFYCSKSILPHLEKVFGGEYEVPLYRGPYVILDCGANAGAFAIWASHRWPGSYIRAYEPHPKTFKLLEQNVENYPYIETIERGLGVPGMRILYNGTNNEGEATLFPNAVSDGTGQHVEIISPLKMPEADILKIDCEGAELEILSPLIEDGRKFRAVMIEFHNEAIRREVDRLLSDYVLLRCTMIDPGCYDIGTAIYMHKELL